MRVKPRRTLRRRNKTTRTQRGGNQIQRDTFVITLDTESERFKRTVKSLQDAHIKYQAYPAVNGLKLSRDTLPNIGIGRALFQSRKEGSEPHNLGAIGCFLSHRNLYRDILNKAKGHEAQYLIFEDDAVVPPTFLHDLEQRLKHVPHDWDIVYMSKMYPIGKDIGHGIIHLKVDPTATKNFGTWGYLIKEKYVRFLYGFLEHMTDQIDAQINRTFGSHQAYCFKDPLVVTQGVKSTIESMEYEIHN